jgi:hypothetical protein
MNGAVLPIPHTPLWLVQGYIYFYLPYRNFSGEIEENFCHCSQSVGRDLKSGLPEHKAGIVL